jgi:AcrR family transcriptional regulator
MARILKNSSERRTEIMNVTWDLFNVQGYDATSINEIIQKTGVAKGTFYYYFKSKDEVLDCVIEREVDKQIEVLQTISNDTTSNALEKIKQILIADKEMHMENIEFLDYLHKKENIVMHQKSLVLSIQKFSPILAEVIKQGIKENLFETNYPQGIVEFILSGMSFLLDPSIFPWSKEEYICRIKVLEDVMQTTLRAEKGSFSFLSAMAEKMFTN